jgi:protein phosphatase
VIRQAAATPHLSRADALQMAVLTDTGRVRPHNEDAVFADPALGLAVLADGMGGYEGGEVASSMATARLAESLVRGLPDGRVHHPHAGETAAVHRHLREEIEAANAEIHYAGIEQPQFAGMGTTLVVAWFYDNRVAVAHIGDSRLYRLRLGRLERLTRDHSVLQEQIDSGIIAAHQAWFAPGRGLVTRALGVHPTVEPELGDFEVRRGDLYLLCSDGLNDMIDDDEIELLLLESGDAPDLAAALLVQLANDRGGRDNVSVILVAVRGSFAAREVWWRRWLPRNG